MKQREHMARQRDTQDNPPPKEHLLKLCRPGPEDGDEDETNANAINTKAARPSWQDLKARACVCESPGLLRATMSNIYAYQRIHNADLPTKKVFADTIRKNIEGTRDKDASLMHTPQRLQ